MNYIKLFAAIIICLMAGFIGSFFTAPAISTWYSGLEKPALNPPNWVFAPVWTTLYILMGIALYLVWDKGIKRKDVRFALQVFACQLILNALWSIAFFGLKEILLAFIVIVALWLLILASGSLFYKIDKRAAYLLIPYILWVSFASYLNYSIWMLNQGPGSL